MNDTFSKICTHFIGMPDVNMDISVFTLRPEIETSPGWSWRFFMKYIDPLLRLRHNSYWTMYPHIFSNLEQVVGTKFKALETMINMNHISEQFSPTPIGKCSEMDMDMDIFSKCQKHYHSLLRFVGIVRTRLAKVKNTQDLLLADLCASDHDTYTFVQRRSKYVFRVSEIRKFVLSSISNTEDFFPEVLDIRNPYNNLPFTECELYKLYFFMKTHNYGIHELFHGFFLSGFDKIKYVNKYEILIRDMAIRNAVLHGSVYKLYPMVFKMLAHFRPQVNFSHLSYGFPKKELVTIMRPYLLLYYFVLYYVQDLPLAFESETILIDKLKTLHQSNYFFGQRIEHNSPSSDIATNSKHMITYNTFCPLFHTSAASKFPTANNIGRIGGASYIELKPHEDTLYDRVTVSKNDCIWNPDYKPSDNEEDHVTNYYRPIIHRPPRRATSLRGTYSDILRAGSQLTSPSDTEVDSVTSLDSDDETVDNDSEGALASECVAIETTASDMLNNVEIALDIAETTMRRMTSIETNETSSHDSEMGEGEGEEKEKEKEKEKEEEEEEEVSIHILVPVPISRDYASTRWVEETTPCQCSECPLCAHNPIYTDMGIERTRRHGIIEEEYDEEYCSEDDEIDDTDSV